MPFVNGGSATSFDKALRTVAYLDKMGIPLDKAKVLPMGEVYALFESASKEEDEDVSDLWARLLANSMNLLNQIGSKRAS